MVIDQVHTIGDGGDAEIHHAHQPAPGDIAVANRPGLEHAEVKLVVLLAEDIIDGNVNELVVVDLERASFTLGLADLDHGCVDIALFGHDVIVILLSGKPNLSPNWPCNLTVSATCTDELLMMRLTLKLTQRVASKYPC